MRDIGILGGGISGLFLAHFLGGDIQVLEASDAVRVIYKLQIVAMILQKPLVKFFVLRADLLFKLFGEDFYVQMRWVIDKMVVNQSCA